MANEPADRITPAPIPTQIPAARKVFISNAGLDVVSRAAFKRAGDVNEIYNRFYAAMKAWGRFELASTPSDADLIFEIRFAAPITDCTKATTYQPQLTITILDAKTHFTLWKILDPVQGAFRQATWEKNVGEGLTNAMAELKTLAAPPAAAIAP
jgi:hypothetical protein